MMMAAECEEIQIPKSSVLCGNRIYVYCHLQHNFFPSFYFTDMVCRCDVIVVLNLTPICDWCVIS